jgi:hypothetical protein
VCVLSDSKHKPANWNLYNKAPDILFPPLLKSFSMSCNKNFKIVISFYWLSFCMREYFMSSDTSRHSLPMYEKPISREKNFKLSNYFENVFQKIETTHFPFYFFKSAIFTALFFFSCCVYSTHIYRLACVFHLASRTAGPFFNGRRLDPAAAVWWEIPRLPGE